MPDGLDAQVNRDAPDGGRDIFSDSVAHEGGMPGRSRIDTRLSLRVTTPGQVALSVAVAATAQPVHEMLTIDPSWGPSARMVRLGHGARFHVLDVRSGDVFVHYQAEVPAGPAPAAEPLTLADLVRYTRPSRYCPSDRLAGFAVAEFGRVDAELRKSEKWFAAWANGCPMSRVRVDRPTTRSTRFCPDRGFVATTHT